MKKFFIALGVICAILIVGYWGLNWWTESKHDKPAYEWIQETSAYKHVKDWFTDDTNVTEDSTVEDDSTEEEIPVETEDGTETTALIGL